MRNKLFINVRERRDGHGQQKRITERPQTQTDRTKKKQIATQKNTDGPGDPRGPTSELGIFVLPHAKNKVKNREK